MNMSEPADEEQMLYFPMTKVCSFKIDLDTTYMYYTLIVLQRGYLAHGDGAN